MKRLGAAIAMFLAGQTAFAQVTAPTPAPVVPPRVGLGTPTSVPISPTSVPTAPAVEFNDPVTMYPVPIPQAIRTPSSYSAPYANSYHADDFHHRTCGPNGCGSSCGSSCGAGCGSGCGDSGCSTCGFNGPCGPPGRFFGEFDALYWRIRGDNLPPLVTVNPTGTTVGNVGIVGAPGTRVLVGGQQDDDWHIGARVLLGYWFDCNQTFGIQVGGFRFDDFSNNQTFTSSGDPPLARPFVNALTGGLNSELVAFPNTVFGAVNVGTETRLYSFDIALRGNMCCGCCYRLDALIGYRYMRFNDNLRIDEYLTAGANAPVNLGVPAGTGINVSDRFNTSNTFNGVQIGFAGEYRFWNFFIFEATTKASIGSIDQLASISGATMVNVPGQAVVQNTGGLLALSSNIGRYSNSDAVVMPEVYLNMAYQITPRIRARLGYSFLYLSSVWRPGNLIDTTVNPALIPPPVGNPLPARPAFQNDHSDFYLHGINAGLEVRF